MLYSKRISQIGYYILKILPTSFKYWTYKKRHLEKASLKGITSVFTHLSMKMIAQHTSGKSNVEVFPAMYIYIYKCGTPVVTGIWDVEEPSNSVCQNIPNTHWMIDTIVVETLYINPNNWFILICSVEACVNSLYHISKPLFSHRKWRKKHMCLWDEHSKLCSLVRGSNAMSPWILGTWKAPGDSKFLWVFKCLT